MTVALALGVMGCAVGGGSGKASAGADKYDTVEKGKLTFAMSGQYKPFNYYDKSGKLTGFDVELGTEVAKRMGLAPNPVAGPFNSLLAGLNARRYDTIIGSMAPSAERKKQVDFSQPYYSAGAQLFVKRGSPIHAKTDLKQATVGVALGTTFEGYARTLPGVKTVKTYQSDNQALTELQSGRLDAVITSRLLGLYQIKAANLQVQTVGDELYPDVAAIPVRRDSQPLLAGINSALASIKADGTYARLSQKWFGQDIS